MDAFTLENLTFTYPNCPEPAVRDLTLTVKKGEFLLLCGASGSGKTTLLRQLKPALSPSGSRQGKIQYQGVSLEDLDFSRQSREIGFVLQDPENQIVTDTVEHELAFGLENLGVPPDTARLRIAEIVEFFGLQECYNQETASLSGGKKQILNLASVMVMQPSVLLLDEPTSMLDPVAASGFFQAVYRINREMGTTVILTEHRLEEVFPLADRVAVMENGELSCLGDPREVGEKLFATGSPMVRALPAPARLFAGEGSPLPLTVREGRACLEKKIEGMNVPDFPARTPREQSPILKIKHLWFRYEKNAPDVLSDLSLSVPRGQIFCLMGGNGSGKTTLLSLIRGLRRPYSGSVQWCDEHTGKKAKNPPSVALLPQNPRILFLHSTVWEDLLEAAPEKGKGEKKKSVLEAVEKAGAQVFLQRHPYDLSGGECQKAGLALLLLQKPDVMLLDEPTKGLDAHSKDELGDLLRKLSGEGKTILMVSHDVEFCGEFGDMCGLLFNGTLVSCGVPEVFFSENRYYTTAVSRMTRGILTGYVTEKDVKAVWRKWKEDP